MTAWIPCVADGCDGQLPACDELGWTQCNKCRRRWHAYDLPESGVTVDQYTPIVAGTLQPAKCRECGDAGTIMLVVEAREGEERVCSRCYRGQRSG